MATELSWILLWTEWIARAGEDLMTVVEQKMLLKIAEVGSKVDNATTERREVMMPAAIEFCTKKGLRRRLVPAKPPDLLIFLAKDLPTT